jgi:hypothetical protein
LGSSSPSGDAGPLQSLIGHRTLPMAIAATALSVIWSFVYQPARTPDR